METMDTARINIKRRRELKGLLQQDLADKLCMGLRSYQSLESGETKLDLERLEQIASILETSIEEVMLSRLLAAKDSESQALKEIVKTQAEEIRYLREKLDKLLNNK